MWSICDVDHSKCYYDYNNKDNSNYCKCLFGYQDSGKNTCVKIAGIQHICRLILIQARFNAVKMLVKCLLPGRCS